MRFVLLAAGILICEHMCHLEDLPDVGFRFHAVPPKFRGVGTFPVRAYATVTEHPITPPAERR